MRTVPSTTGEPLRLQDVTLHELDLPRPDMGGLDPHTRELFVSRGMTTRDCAQLLERLQRPAGFPFAVCEDCPAVFDDIDQREAHMRLTHDQSPQRRGHTVRTVRRA